MSHFVKKHPFVIVSSLINAVVLDLFSWVDVCQSSWLWWYNIHNFLTKWEAKSSLSRKVYSSGGPFNVRHQISYRRFHPQPTWSPPKSICQSPWIYSWNHQEDIGNGEDVLISGFGKFCVKEKNDRRGRNPQTGEDLMLGSRRVVGFKCSGKLRERMNGKG